MLSSRPRRRQRRRHRRRWPPSRGQMSWRWLCWRWGWGWGWEWGWARQRSRRGRGTSCQRGSFAAVKSADCRSRATSSGPCPPCPRRVVRAPRVTRQPSARYPRLIVLLPCARLRCPRRVLGGHIMTCIFHCILGSLSLRLGVPVIILTDSRLTLWAIRTDMTSVSGRRLRRDLPVLLMRSRCNALEESACIDT